MALMALLWTANAQAEDYGFAIGQKRVTSENYTNISAEGGFDGVLGGKVTYNPQTKTLTLEEATIKNGLFNGTQVGLTIVVKGRCLVIRKGFTALRCDVPTIVEGGSLDGYHLRPTLHCQSDAQGIKLYCHNYYGPSLTIRNCDVMAIGKWGVTGTDGTKGEHVTVESNAYLYAEGEKGGLV